MSNDIDFSGEDVKFTRRDYSYIPGRMEIAMRIMAGMASGAAKLADNFADPARIAQDPYAVSLTRSRAQLAVLWADALLAELEKKP